jgi:hypothetical protein
MHDIMRACFVVPCNAPRVRSPKTYVPKTILAALGHSLAFDLTALTSLCLAS